MQGAKRSDTPLYREHLQRRSAPAADEPNVQVTSERALSGERVAERSLQHHDDIQLVFDAFR